MKNLSFPCQAATWASSTEAGGVKFLLVKARLKEGGAIRANGDARHQGD